jgi:hypothetical protein
MAVTTHKWTRSLGDLSLDGDVIKKCGWTKGADSFEVEQIHPKCRRFIRFSIAFHKAQELIHK